MKTSLIALAVAAALPVAAQADVTLSGSVSAEYTLGSNMEPAIDTSFGASSSEVLSNGMTATASFDVLGGDAQGTISLAGDFGTLKGGSAAAADDASDADETSENIKGISFAGTFAGIAVDAATGTWDHDSDDAANDRQEYTTYGASYDFNGLTVSARSKTKTTGTAATNEISAAYALGDLTLSVKNTDTTDSVVKAAYSATMGDLAVALEADSGSAWEVVATYTLGDISVTAKDSNSIGSTEISAAYASGALSVAIAADNEVTVGYDLGNADLSLVTNSTDTKVKYSVAF